MLPVDGGDADAVIARVQEVGVDVPALAETLQSDGGATFEKAWDELLQSLGAKSAQLAATAGR
jgi:transaldolase